MNAFFRFVAVASLTVATLVAQDSAQPKLPTTPLTVNGKTITAEVADEPQERTIGLMYRKSLEADSGMVFVMPRIDHVSFWMKNTTVPLSIAYINASGVILEIHDLKPLDEKPVPSSFPTIAYALEMDQGWFAKNKVLPGDRIRGLPPLP